MGSVASGSAIWRFAVASCFAVLNCGCANMVGQRLDPRLPSRAAVLFFVDGLDADRLDTLAELGRVPTIRRQFLEGGLQLTEANACVPTVTYPNAVSLMTGCLPGRHGITSNEWFDRASLRRASYLSASTYLDVDRDYAVQTIYEALAQDITVNVQCAVSRGATWRFNPQLANGFDWASGRYERVDSRAGNAVRSVLRRSQRSGDWPVLQTYYFPGVDKVAHVAGVATARYAAAVENVDKEIARVVRAVKSVGAHERTHYWLVSDHGQMVCDRHRELRLLYWLRKRTGLRVIEGRRFARSRLGHEQPDRHVDVVIETGRRHAMIHVRGRGGWAPLADAERVDRVVGALSRASPDQSDSGDFGTSDPVDGIRAVYYRMDDNRIGVVTRDGRRVLDPIRKKDEFVTTANDEPEDAEMIALFESSRAGDVIVFAADGWMLHTTDCGGHGGASVRERRIPLFVSGPGVASGTHCDVPVSIVDVMPTILDVLGRRADIPPDIDGRSVAHLVLSDVAFKTAAHKLRSDSKDRKLDGSSDGDSVCTDPGQAAAGTPSNMH